MSIGTYISVTMHASMVGWLLLNGNFESNPREISVTEVSLVSAEMFDIALIILLQRLRLPLKRQLRSHQ